LEPVAPPAEGAAPAPVRPLIRPSEIHRSPGESRRKQQRRFRRTERAISLVVVIPALLIFAWISAAPIGDDHELGTVAAGRAILQTRDLAGAATLISSQAAVVPAETPRWLADVTTALVEGRWGPRGLRVAHALLVVATLTVAFFVFRAYAGGATARVWWGAYAVSLGPSFGSIASLGRHLIIVALIGYILRGWRRSPWWLGALFSALFALQAQWDLAGATLCAGLFLVTACGELLRVRRYFASWTLEGDSEFIDVGTANKKRELPTSFMQGPWPAAPRPVRAFAFATPPAVLVIVSPGFPRALRNSFELKPLLDAAYASVSSAGDAEGVERLSGMIQGAAPPIAVAVSAFALLVVLASGVQAIFRRIDPGVFVFSVVAAILSFRHPTLLPMAVLSIRYSLLSFRTTRRETRLYGAAMSLSLGLVPFAAAFVIADLRSQHPYIDAPASGSAVAMGDFDGRSLPVVAIRELANRVDSGDVLCRPAWAGTVQYFGEGRLRTFGSERYPARSELKASILVATRIVEQGPREPSVAAVLARLAPAGFVGPSPSVIYARESITPPGYEEISRKGAVALRRIQGVSAPP